MTEDYEACRQLDPSSRRTSTASCRRPIARASTTMCACAAPCRSRVAGRTRRPRADSDAQDARCSTNARRPAAARTMRARRRRRSQSPPTGEPRWPVWRARLAPLALAATPGPPRRRRVRVSADRSLLARDGRGADGRSPEMFRGERCARHARGADDRAGIDGVALRLDAAAAARIRSAPASSSSARGRACTAKAAWRI